MIKIFQRLPAGIPLAIEDVARAETQILRALNVGKMRLLASPRKIPSMTGFGLEITGFVDKN